MLCKHAAYPQDKKIHEVAERPGVKRELHMDFPLQLISEVLLADQKCVQHSTDLHLFRSAVLGLTGSLMHSNVWVRITVPQLSWYILPYYC